jgi:hypothetical protein
MSALPSIFKSVLWSYDFDKCDPEKMKRTIILQALNYGSLNHWKWLQSFYGSEEINQVLAKAQVTEIHPKTKTLIEAIFNFNNWNHASGGTK